MAAGCEAAALRLKDPRMKKRELFNWVEGGEGLGNSTIGDGPFFFLFLFLPSGGVGEIR